ncbi:cystathionine gamma-synthase [Arcobacter sp. 31_11_sub10_T18]|nr:cystathionine gamma-synthase [Arcobacter sp. 31_11_sub10_T18]
MKPSIFSHIPCGQTLPVNNIHAVSVSMPTLQEVIDYEENTNGIHEKITSAYPRFLLHPYLKRMAIFLQEKYKISDQYEIVVVSSQKAVQLISDKYYIHNPIVIDEPFGVILVMRGTCQLQKVLTYIQHVGCNLSSRFAQDYLYKHGLLDILHEEELEEDSTSEEILISTLANAYEQPISNICLAPSGMNAVYSVLEGLKAIQQRNNRDILVQLGWLYLDTMNIVKNHYNQSKLFYDINALDELEAYLKIKGNNVSAVITELPTNPLLITVDVVRLKKLCDTYNIPLVIDSTFATPYNLNLKPYADICIESLTKYACGNADVLMGAVIINENSKLACCSPEFFKHADKPYIKDIQRLAFQVQNYESRMKKINANATKLVAYLKTKSFIDNIYYALDDTNKENYSKLMRYEDAIGGVISLTFTKSFEKVYDTLNFAKGPSLGTEFTLLMPYVYLAHYDLIICEDGREILEENNIPIDLMRVAVGIEDIDEIIREFEKLDSI